jgi:hypothetical protein
LHYSVVEYFKFKWKLWYKGIEWEASKSEAGTVSRVELMEAVNNDTPLIINGAPAPLRPSFLKSPKSPLTQRMMIQLENEERPSRLIETTYC